MPTPEKIAAVLPTARALLPSNSTPLERALLAAELARLADVDPDVIRTVWDPATCPAQLLPYLAWSLSVDVWDEAWPEAVKRDVIAAAPAVHRRKGTRGAVDRALAAMRLRASIKEWWQKAPNGQRGTFDVTVFVGDHLYDPSLPILSEQVQRNALATLRATKPKSRTMNFALGAGFSQKLGVAGRAAASALADLKGAAAPDLARRSRLLVADQAAALAADQRNAAAAPDLRRRSIIQAASRLACLQVQYVRCEAQ